MSNLLIDEYPIILLPNLARVIGVNEAVILQQIHYWLNNYMRTNSLSHYKDGKWWVFNSVREWQTNFPFWSQATIARTLKVLREPYPLPNAKKKKNDPRVIRKPLLIATDKYNQRGYDKTLWYTICYDEVERIEQHLPVLR